MDGMHAIEHDLRFLGDRRQARTFLIQEAYVEFVTLDRIETKQRVGYAKGGLANLVHELFYFIFASGHFLILLFWQCVCVV
jgi:hypothetical protein